MIAVDALYAAAAMRDRFLNALDSHDEALSAELASNLTSCMNPLPGMTCGELGLPAGSTYGSAARHILLLDADRRASRARSDPVDVPLAEHEPA